MSRDSILQAVDDAMRALHAAVAARDLYSPEHPAVRAQEARAVESLAPALAHEPHVCVMAFEDRAVCLNAALPSGPLVLETLFARLRARGLDAITFRPGIDAAQLARLLDWLASPAGTPQPPMPNLRLSRLDGLAKSSPDPADATGAAHAAARTFRDTQDHAASLDRLWRLLHQRGECDADAVEAIVAEICAAVAVSSGAMAPLASLKHHDEYTFVHTINVAILAAALAEAVGLPPGTVHDLAAAALLHDVGKQAMPPELLNKSSALTEAEQSVMRRHPVEGARILYNAAHVPEVAPIVAFEHHMHLDGTGYPPRPAGWRPAFFSQIVQIADVFDALRTDRPYRAAMTAPQALDVLRQHAGLWFDPDLLDVFVRRVVTHVRPDAA
jgi:putative nucleotidyltransferase with HDIG domain